MVTCCSGGYQPDEGWTAGVNQKAQHKKKKKKGKHSTSEGLQVTRGLLGAGWQRTWDQEG